MDHVYLIKLIIGYGCVGIFLATAILVLLAIAGLNVIPDSSQRERLFKLLVVQIVLIGVGIFSGLVAIDPKPVVKELEAGAKANETLVALESDPSSPDTAVNIASRVYVHISSSAQRETAERIQKILRADNMLVPGIEDVGARSPEIPELRYFRESESQLADEITESLQSNGITVEPLLLTGFDLSKIRPRHFEIWLPKQ